ncbi:PQQ-binding-like beta-propeller repeat protein [Streptomyces sp. NPDC005271]|uniref:outer membrane protein assembly factor BamB family protein n=1 Tax=unclassified Streptomyces TaxID=2593676 RepID=UPI0033BEDDB2
MLATGRWVVGKDRRGNLTKWSLDTLHPVGRLNLQTMCDGTSETVPDTVGGADLTAWNGRIYTTDHRGHLVVVDIETFSIETVIPSLAGDSASLHCCTEHPSVHTMVDRLGRIFLGSLATPAFPVAATVECGRVQQIRYDAHHDRFWAVERVGEERSGLRGGVVIVTLDGAVECEIPFSRYELSFLKFSPDYATAYAGGPEGVIHVVDNTDPTPRLVRNIGGFPNQLTDLAVGRDGSLFLLTLSNELVKIDSALDCVQARAPMSRQSAWALAPAVDEPRRLYCGTDDGVAVLDVRHALVGGPTLLPSAHHASRFGVIRQLAGTPDGYLGIGQKNVVFCADAGGKLIWHAPLDDTGFELAVSADHERVLVATGVGAVELDAATGEPLACLSLDGVPLSAAAYGPAGERILGNRDGVVCAFAANAADELWWIDTKAPPERIWSQDGAVYVSCAAGLLEVAPGQDTVSRRWGGQPCATIAAACANGLVHLACDEGELHTYDYATGDQVGAAVDLPDVPRAMTVERSPANMVCLIIGGRGGYLSTYRVSSTGVPIRLRETYLPRRGGSCFRLQPH